MFFSIFAHKFSKLSIFCHFQLQFSKKNHYLCGDKREDG